MGRHGDTVGAWTGNDAVVAGLGNTTAAGVLLLPTSDGDSIRAPEQRRLCEHLKTVEELVVTCILNAGRQAAAA
jgi:hypothetical protein